MAVLSQHFSEQPSPGFDDNPKLHALPNLENHIKVASVMGFYPNCTQNDQNSMEFWPF